MLLAGLSDVELDWLRLLVGDWQVLADLSMADLVLWVRRPDGAPDGAGSWFAVAHARPTTSQMVFVEDVVGRAGEAVQGLEWAARTGGRVHLGGREVQPGQVVDEDAVGVRASHQQTPGGVVLTRHTLAGVLRAPSVLERRYRAMADDLLTMIAQGEFPTLAATTGRRRGAPRVGDGVLRLDPDGAVEYASPNAVSALHRLGVTGPLTGLRLVDMIADLPRTASSSLTPVDEALPVVLTGRAAWWSEIDTGTVQVSVRAIPVVLDGRRGGALVLMRDVSSLRRGEQVLLSREASVREVHHRVKNNLQTVSALLRLQARRTADAAARGALETAVQRLGAISIVHESLAQTADEVVDLDLVVDRVVDLVLSLDLGAGPERGIAYRREGSFGEMGSEPASAVAMVVCELVQNVVTHGGQDDLTVEVRARRFHPGAGDSPTLEVQVLDDGRGLVPGPSTGGSGLGRQIVEALVCDLGGTVAWAARVPHGTRVTFTARV